MSAGAEWSSLTAFSETYTCYSSAVATWVAHEREDWPSAVNPGLALTVLDAGEGLFGFAHFPPRLRAELELVRVGLDGPGPKALEGVLAELERSGRVIVAGDGFRLPWHVAHDRRHVPHWYVLAGTPDRLEVIDPFACRNELGVQEARRVPIAREQLPELLVGLPGGDPVLELRERLALGDECDRPGGDCQWFVRGEVADSRGPAGAEGADGALALARHFRERGQHPRAYAQADDIWSIARHRAFLAHHARSVAERTSDAALAAWVQEHGETLAKRWSHMAPLIMQATLSLSSGRAASASVPDTLEDLAGRERAAAQAFPSALDVGSI
ncbi:MAG TPA: hypothetical protein VFY36_00025 [Solirubrobacteraceae bacterium]|nr:hypothetical protein [Solirubrobacteraceae bacterium]